MRKAIAARCMPKDIANADVVFITRRGLPWCWTGNDATDGKNHFTDSIGFMAGRLFRKLGINHGASFYSLRRMTETIGGGCKDQVAVDAVMGHSRGDMASVYRLDIDDSRLEAVADHIHGWLFPATATAATASEKGVSEHGETK